MGVRRIRTESRTQKGNRRKGLVLWLRLDWISGREEVVEGELQGQKTRLIEVGWKAAVRRRCEGVARLFFLVCGDSVHFASQVLGPLPRRIPACRPAQPASPLIAPSRSNVKPVPACPRPVQMYFAETLQKCPNVSRSPYVTGTSSRVSTFVST